MRALVEGDNVPYVPPPERAALPETMSPGNLSSEHLTFLNRALTNVLDTEVAEFTFAQIVDGLPTLSSWTEFHWLRNWDNHPIQQHESLCLGAMDKVRAFRSEFDPLSLKFAPSVLQAFQDQSSGTKAFYLRLIELVAVACHQIAAFLFDLERSKNAHINEYSLWVAEQQKLKDAGDERYLWESIEPPTAFYHQSYIDHEQYPRGVADVVGYWAEAKIFGGVLLFDRGQSDSECNEVFLHPARIYGPTTIYPPTSDQFHELVVFLSSTDGSATCPLPITPSELNRPRYYRYHATKYFHIFRDKYDSRLPSRFIWPDTASGMDFPELNDRLWLMNHQGEVTNYGIQPDEARIRAATESLKNITPSSPVWGFDPNYE